MKRLYKGATLEDATDDVGMAQSTSSRWVGLWNEGGLGQHGFSEIVHNRLIQIPISLGESGRSPLL
jgi:hypothetical protein